jgi:hypothetical protein
MRDHPNHGVAILGGTWGVKLTRPEIRQKFEKSFNDMFDDTKEMFGSRSESQHDQNLLKTHIW